MTTGAADPAGPPDTIQPGSLAYRPVRPEELGACAEVWRHGINDYTRRLNQPDVPPDTASLVRLYAHLQSTDPERFVVAVTTGPDGERIVAFAAAVQREALWFLSMLFVLPEAQGAGVGRALLERVAPGADGSSPDAIRFRATATDSAQPISNALYASYGIVPRVPLMNLLGNPTGPEPFGELPSGVTPVAFDDLAGAGSDGHRVLVDAVDGLDRMLLGVAHPVDHRYIRGEGRRGWLYRGPDDAVLGYGYASEAGRVGPIAVLDEALLGPVLGHLTSAVTPRGAFAIWLPGTADRAIVPALRAGFRLDQFPLLLCWDRPFVDLARYLPISPGLL